MTYSAEGGACGQQKMGEYNMLECVREKGHEGPCNYCVRELIHPSPKRKKAKP